MSNKKDRELGMECPIHRRDFLQGTAVTAATLAMASQADAQATPGTQDTPGYYPPLQHGLRGSHPGAFEAAHSVRDGTFWDHAEKPEDVTRVFDLIVVGAGISGLSAAPFASPCKIADSVCAFAPPPDGAIESATRAGS